MTKVFLIVIAMLSTSPQDQKDLYVIQKPSFTSLQQCVQFVQINNMSLIQKATTAYPNRAIENIFCVEQEKLKTLISGTQA